MHNSDAQNIIEQQLINERRNKYDKTRKKFNAIHNHRRNKKRKVKKEQNTKKQTKRKKCLIEAKEITHSP